MKVDELREIINKSTSVLVMDNGSPSFVVMGYEQYKDLVKNGEEKEVLIKQKLPASDNKVESVAANLSQRKEYRSDANEGELEILERINKDIQILREEIEKEEKSMNVD